MRKLLTEIANTMECTGAGCCKEYFWGSSFSLRRLTMASSHRTTVGEAQTGQSGDSTVVRGKAPVSVDYQQFFSKLALRAKGTALRQNAEYMVQDSFVKLGTGFPCPDMFPLVEAHFKLQDGSVLHVNKPALQKHLQYGLTQGYPDLREWVIEFQRRVHCPPTLLDAEHAGHFDLIITSGALDAIYTAFKVVLNEGDWVLMEEATFSTTVDMARQLGAVPLGVPTDRDGILPDQLEHILTSWNSQHPGVRKPKVLYIIPSCGNPTGITTSLERRKAIYQLARAHDLLIFDDDPYFFLDYTRPLIPSFLSMDVDGRVVRMDSFSKVIAPGMRVGWLSGPRPILQKTRLVKDVSTLTTSGLVQVLMSQMLRHWGHEGFLRHADTVMEFYKRKIDFALTCAQKHLTGLAEWNAPSGGMFLWLRVLGVSDSQLVMNELLKDKVVVVCGNSFFANQDKNDYIRICITLVNDEQCDTAFSCLAKVIRNLQKTEK